MPDEQAESLTPKQQDERLLLQLLFDRLEQLNEPVPDQNHIEFGDRPDSIWELDGFQIGVEITRALSEPQMAADTREVKEVVEARRRGEGPHFNPAPPSVDERIWPRISDVCDEWSSRLLKIVMKKRERLNAVGFRQFPGKNRLYIYDYPGLGNDDPSFNYGKAFFTWLVRQPISRPVDFDLVYIHSGPYLFRWEPKVRKFHYCDKFNRSPTVDPALMKARHWSLDPAKTQSR